MLKCLIYVQKVDISLFAFLRKKALAQNAILRRFSILFYGIFRINVELNFALNLLNTNRIFLNVQKTFDGHILNFPGETSEFKKSYKYVKCEIQLNYVDSKNFIDKY